MRPKGTIYRKGKSQAQGSVLISLPFIERLAYHIVRTAGVGFLGFAIIGFFFAYGPVIREEASYSISNKSTNEVKLKIAEAEKVADIQKQADYWGVGSYYSLVVPKIGAASNVIANVDPVNENEYNDALLKGVAHAAGTYFPGQGGNVFLFSHSTDSPLNVGEYNAVFYLLRKLEKGDLIIVFFADKKYEYRVSEVIATSADDVSYLNEKTNSERLVLQTCDPPGTTWRRLLVIAYPVSNNSELSI